MTVEIVTGDAIGVLSFMPEGHFRTCVTSPPYWGLRDYGIEGQLGQESTPDAFCDALVAVFAEVRRVLADDGTLWVNLGDSYSSGSRKTQVVPTLRRKGHDEASGKHAKLNGFASRPPVVQGLGPKQLVGIPWRFALAMQRDGWILRQDIIWHKPNPMPHPVRDRCVGAHEYLFLFAKKPRYFFDYSAMQEPATYAGQKRGGSKKRYEQNSNGMDNKVFDTRTRRSVWSINPKSAGGAHFAVFPPKLVEPCILAGSATGDRVLDPFGGSGTTGIVAANLGRHATLIELNPEYAELSRTRVLSAGHSVAPDAFPAIMEPAQ